MNEYTTRREAEITDVMRGYDDSRLSEDRDMSKDSIDNCACPPCGCLLKAWLLPLSPAGIGAAGGIFLATSPL